MNKNENSPNEKEVSRERRGSGPQQEAESNLNDAPKQTKPAPVGCTAGLGVAVDSGKGCKMLTTHFCDDTVKIVNNDLNVVEIPNWAFGSIAENFLEKYRTTQGAVL